MPTSNRAGKLIISPATGEMLNWTSQRPTEADWDAMFMSKAIIKANAGEFVSLIADLQTYSRSYLNRECLLYFSCESELVA